MVWKGFGSVEVCEVLLSLVRVSGGFVEVQGGLYGVCVDQCGSVEVCGGL